MALEALAAVGLAGNIVQFIDFSCRLFSTTTSIHRSYAGSSRSIQDIENVAQELQQWCGKVASLRNAQGHPPASQHNQSLVKLAEDCQTAAVELLSAVHALKAKNPKSKWNSFRAALAMTWKESQIADMETRLDSYRKQLALELSLMQRYRM